MMLSDRTIRDLLQGPWPMIMPPPPDARIQPATVDLVLDEGLTVEPGDFCLASTLEYLRLPSDIAGWVAGRSTFARLGLTVEQAGFVDPGFCGQITLELHNVSRKAITLEPAEAVCQIAFMRLDRPAARPYGSAGLGSHYQEQRGPTRAWLESA